MVQEGRDSSLRGTRTQKGHLGVCSPSREVWEVSSHCHSQHWHIPKVPNVLLLWRGQSPESQGPEPVLRATAAVKEFGSFTQK